MRICLNWKQIGRFVTYLILPVLYVDCSQSQFVLLMIYKNVITIFFQNLSIFLLHLDILFPWTLTSSKPRIWQVTVNYYMVDSNSNIVFFLILTDDKEKSRHKIIMLYISSYLQWPFLCLFSTFHFIAQFLHVCIDTNHSSFRLGL